MSIQEKLQTKLKPHTDKILNNQADDFDYLPAVLDYLIQEHENQKLYISKLITNQQNIISDSQKELSKEISSAKENQATQIAKLSQTLNETIEQAENNQKQAIADLKADNEALQAAVASLVSSTNMLKWINMALLIIVLIAVFIFFRMR